MTALCTSEPSDEDAQAFCEPVHVDTGFVYEHRLLFTEWLTSTTFKSVVPRKTFEVRSEVLCALAGGQSPRQIAEKGMASMTFVQKTRQNYSLDQRGDLYYHARKGKGALLVIPDDQVFDTIVQEHNALHHQGTSKTWHEVSARYHGIPKRAVDWVLQRCILCHAYRPGPRPAPTQPIPSHRAMERVQMDLIDMRQEPDGKFRWILHIKDHHTRFCMLYPLRHRRERDVLYYFLQWIAMMGPPAILQTDNGTEFVNPLLSQVAIQHHILVRRSQPGRPRSQGLVERANGHVRKLIAKWCHQFGERQWARCLPTIAFSCNTSVHASTNKSPFEMVFGRRPQWQRVRSASPLDLGPTSQGSLSKRTDDLHTATPSSTPRHDPVYPRGSCVSISITGVDRSPLDVYRIPAVVLSHKKHKGYRVATAWGILSKRVAPRHVLPLPEGHHLPARALAYLHPGTRAPYVRLSDCLQQLHDADPHEKDAPSQSMQMPSEAYESS